MKIDFLHGKNPYQSTSHFAEKLGEALSREGVSVRHFFIDEGNFYKAFQAIFNEPPDLTCSFSDITVGDGQPLGDQWEIPHLSFLIDPAIYFLHQAKGRFSLLTCVDHDDCALIRNYCPRTLFLPHAVEKEIEDKKEERIYDVSFLGTCVDYEKVRQGWKRKFPRFYRQMEEAAERVLFSSLSILQALQEVGLQENLMLLHHEVDLYIGAKDRVELARSLHSFDLHVWGKGPWKKFLPHAHHHRALPFKKTLDVMQKTKVLLNSSPRFKRGSHERLFYGVASGAATISSKSEFVSQAFGESIPTYSLDELEKSASLIASLLEKERKRADLVKEGQAKVTRHHTWDRRVRVLLPWIQDALKTRLR